MSIGKGIRNASNMLIDIHGARKKINAWEAELKIIERKEEECEEITQSFRAKGLRTMYINAKYKFLEPILKNIRKWRRQTEDKILNYTGVIDEETKKTRTNRNKMYNVDLKSLFKCRICATSDEKSVMAWCETCKRLLCDSCVLMHLTKKTYHSIEYDKCYMNSYSYKKRLLFHSGLVVKAVQCVNCNGIAVIHQDKSVQHDNIFTNFSVFEYDGNRKHNIILSKRQIEFDRGFIAPISDDVVITTHDSASFMETVNYTQGRILNRIPIQIGENEKITGVAFMSNQLYVGLSNGIDILNLLGEKQSRIELNNFQILRPLGNGKIYCRHQNVSSCDSNSSYIDITSNITSPLTDFTFDPIDVTMDDEGTIIFVNDGVVCQVGQSGNGSKVIITQRTDFVCPIQYVSWEHSSKTLVCSTKDCIDIYSKN